MKNNKILALALSAGLVFAGSSPSYAAEATETPAAETTTEAPTDTSAETTNEGTSETSTDTTEETTSEASTDTTEETTSEASDEATNEEPTEESNDKYYVVGKREEKVTEDQIDEASEKFIENKDEIITAFLNNNDAELEDFLKTSGLLNLMKVEDFRAYLQEVQKNGLSETDADIIRGLSKKNIDEFSKRALIDYIVKKETDFNKVEKENPNRLEGTRVVVQDGEKGTDYLVVTEGPLSSLWKVGQYFDPDEVGGFAAGNETMFTEVSRKSIGELTDAEIELIFGKEGKIFPKYNVNWETGVVETDENGRPVKYTGEGLTKDEFKKLVKEAKDEITEVGTGKSGENGLISLDDWNDLQKEKEKPAPTPETPGKLVTIDQYLTEVGMETEELARKQAEDDLGSKGLEGLYDIEVIQGDSGRWFYRFVPKEDDVVEVPTPLIPLLPSEEVIPAPEQKPGNDHIVIPSIPEFPTDEDEVVVPGTVVDPVVDEDKPVVIGNDDEQKAKDLTDKLNNISKEIKDTLVENEKEIAKEEEKPSDDNKEEVKPSDDNKEEGEKEEKEDKNDDKKADAKKEDKKVEATKVVKHSNPKTGVESLVPVVSTLAISMAGIVATRKKNN